jgi:hypothetical protein
MKIFYLVIQLEIYMNAPISPADALIEGFICSHALRQYQNSSNYFAVAMLILLRCIASLFVPPKKRSRRHLVIQLEIYMNAPISPADALIEGFICSHALRQLQLHLSAGDMGAFMYISNWITK